MDANEEEDRVVPSSVLQHDVGGGLGPLAGLVSGDHVPAGAGHTGVFATDELICALQSGEVGAPVAGQ